MDDESGDDNRDELTSEWGGESRCDWRGWRNESGSWFQRRGDAYLNERSVIFNEEMVCWRENVTTDEELGLTSHSTHYRSFWEQFYHQITQPTQPTASRHWRTMVSQPGQWPIPAGSATLTGCKNFVGKREKFIFKAFIDLKRGVYYSIVVFNVPLDTL